MFAPCAHALIKVVCENVSHIACGSRRDADTNEPMAMHIFRDREGNIVLWNSANEEYEGLDPENRYHVLYVKGQSNYQYLIRNICKWNT